MGDLVDLDLPRTVGRASIPVSGEVVRPLEASDIALLETERGIKPPALKKIRDSHHALAQALAGGLRPAEASILTGYSPSRISILQNDPAFQELVQFYRADVQKVFADLSVRMGTLSLDAAAELQERLSDNPESFSNVALLELVKTLADRTGFGPKTTTVNLNVDLAGRLQTARQRAGLEAGPPLLPSRGSVIDAETKVIEPPVDDGA